MCDVVHTSIVLSLTGDVQPDKVGAEPSGSSTEGRCSSLSNLPSSKARGKAKAKTSTTTLAGGEEGNASPDLSEAEENRGNEAGLMFCVNSEYIRRDCIALV